MSAVAACGCYGNDLVFDLPECVAYPDAVGLGVFSRSCLEEREWELTDAEFAQLECVREALHPDPEHEDEVSSCGSYSSRFPYDPSNPEEVCLDCVDYYLTRYAEMCEPILGSRLEEEFALCRIEGI